LTPNRACGISSQRPRILSDLVGTHIHIAHPLVGPAGGRCIKALTKGRNMVYYLCSVHGPEEDLRQRMPRPR
jgi:hypothetical protein